MAGEPVKPSVTIDYLQDWELHGATWRPLHVSDQRAEIELCSCSGEPMDRVESGEPELIAYVRAHRADRPAEAPE